MPECFVLKGQYWRACTCTLRLIYLPGYQDEQREYSEILGIYHGPNRSPSEDDNDSSVTGVTTLGHCPAADPAVETCQFLTPLAARCL